MSVVMGDALVQGNVVLGHTNQSDIYAAAPIVYLRMNEGTPPDVTVGIPQTLRKKLTIYRIRRVFYENHKNTT